MMKRFGVSNVSVIAGGVTEQDQNNGNMNNNGINGNNNIAGGQAGAAGMNGVGNNIQQLNGSNIQTTSENDFWKDLKEVILALLLNNS